MKQLKEAKIRKEKRQHFNDWLRAQKDRDDVVADLSRNVSQDPEFPCNGGLVGRVRYLESCCACAEAIEALRIAWAEYAHLS